MPPRAGAKGLQFRSDSRLTLRSARTPTELASPPLPGISPTPFPRTRPPMLFRAGSGVEAGTEAGKIATSKSWQLDRFWPGNRGPRSRF